MKNISAIRPAKRASAVVGRQLAVVNEQSFGGLRLVRNSSVVVRNFVRRRVEYQPGDVVASQSCEVSL
ncbi:hypothetical protein KF397_005081 [Salmonella enterica subsp. enterica serovar Oranienburg]|nr:hypothetical protein [Salmonella enterica subsp. enterica serovar Oranienburg]